MAPFFTIAVTTFDRWELLNQALSSVLSQTFSDFEVIIGNDNPTREITARALAIADPRIRFVNHPKNLGEFENMNTLLHMSRGSYFTWIADDDIYAPDFLQRVREALQAHNFPTCVFTSFQLIRETEVVDSIRKLSGEVKLLSGREFLRLYLAREIETIGTMGVCKTDYLRKWGGLEDTSADGAGLYCEYVQMLRASTQEKICYIDSPLMYFRVHDKSWSASLNTDVAQYQRATTNLISSAIEFFQRPDKVNDFGDNLKNLLRWFMGDFVIVSRRGGSLGLTGLLKYFLSARSYVSSLKGSRLYGKARRSLISAEIWLFWALFKQKILAVAPPRLVDFAYSVRAALGATPRPERCRSN